MGHGLAALGTVSRPGKFFCFPKKLSDSEFEIVFTGKAEAGWHVYSTDIPDGGPTPATINFDEQKGVEPVGKLTARGKVHKAYDNLFGMEVSYMENTAVFAQKMRITDATYSVKGYLNYGACNDENCMPPTNVEFAFTGTGKSAAKAPADKDKKEKSEKGNEALAAGKEKKERQGCDRRSRYGHEYCGGRHLDIDRPRTGGCGGKRLLDTGGRRVGGFGEDASNAANQAWWKIFLLGFLGGLVALLTPCVWPIIPMTVSFFLKRSGDKRKGIRDAATYGVSIVVIYVLLGLVITGIFGASALNALSTNAVFNIFFFLMLLVFAASFFGAFEITLPSSWSNAVDSKAESTTGLLSIFLMAFTLALVSFFSCTGADYRFSVGGSVHVGQYPCPDHRHVGFCHCLGLAFHPVCHVSGLAEDDAEIR